jgi:hypothetical protein
MIRLIAAAALATAVATSAQAMSPAPLHQPDGMTTQVAYGCGAGSAHRAAPPPSAAIPLRRQQL